MLQRALDDDVRQACSLGCSEVVVDLRVLDRGGGVLDELSRRGVLPQHRYVIALGHVLEIELVWEPARSRPLFVLDTPDPHPGGAVRRVVEDRGVALEANDAAELVDVLQLSYGEEHLAQPALLLDEVDEL